MLPKKQRLQRRDYYRSANAINIIIQPIKNWFTTQLKRVKNFCKHPKGLECGSSKDCTIGIWRNTGEYGGIKHWLIENIKCRWR